jgi:hypothetical protein
MHGKNGMRSVNAATSWLGRLGTAAVVALTVAFGGLTQLPEAQAAAGPTLEAARGSSVQQVVRSKPDVHADLQNVLSSGKPTAFAIYFERPDLSPAFSMDWEQRGRFVHETMVAAAERLQAPVHEHMRARNYTFHSFWVDNMIVVENGDRLLLDDLTLFEGVKQARLLPPVHLIEPEPAPAGTGFPGPIPNLVRIKAPQAWALGASGQNIVVANIDTGVRFSHDALRDKYRGNLGGGTYDHNYNYFNPYSADIGDAHDHGSHTMGTIVGGTAAETIGVAPDAKWIACRGFNPSATDAGLLGCAQWIAAPTNLVGANPDPSQRPHVVNNSWGDCGRTYDPWYQGVINTWIAAGIVPIFSNGNASNCSYASPPGLNTVGNPARYGSVLGIGSTQNNNGLYANHSNWGPTDNPNPGTNPSLPDPRGFPNLKPNVMAPGVAIRSAVRATDSSYANFTGTSMSSPHVTGLVALMWDVAPCLIGDYATTGTILTETATPMDYNSVASPPPGPGNLPNYATGWGEIDAEAAVLAAIAACGPQGTIAGTVTSSAGGTPIEGVSVTIIPATPPPAQYVLTTDAAGQYSRAVGEADDYELHFARYGFLPEIVTGVDVVEGATTTVNVELDPAPSFTVSGTVTDADTGWGLHARIDIGGYPDGPVWTDPVTGAYSIVLVGGFEYTFSVSTEIPGYVSTARDVGPLSANETEDFALAAHSSCTAPGRSAAGAVTEHFEGSFPPAGWNVVNNGGTCIWKRNDQLGQAGTANRPNYAGGEGFSAAADSDRCGSGTTMNTDLFSPPTDLSAMGSPALEYIVSYRHLGTSSLGTAISTDGGTTWTNLEVLTASVSATGPGTPKSFDLSAYGSATDARFRFRYIANSWDWWGQVDQVRVRSTVCSVPDGDLIVGRVSDENTSVALVGALVDAGSTAAASYVSADPAVGAGFYAVYAPLSATSVEADGAPVHPGYGIGSTDITVVGTTTQRADIEVPAPLIDVSPTSVSETLPLGDSSSTNLLLDNLGNAPATVELAITTLVEHFEAPFPPAGWTVENAPGVTAGCGWKRNDEWGAPNLAGGDGFAAVADSDACGQGTTTHSMLTSPPLSFAPGPVTLQFVLAYRHLGSSFLRIETSTDGGTTWVQAQNYAADVSPSGPGLPQTVNLPVLSGEANARIRFRYSGGWDWWAHVDQVRVNGATQWLSLSPASGTIPANDSLDVTLDFDAGSVPSPGVYEATISIAHNSPYPVDPVPVSLTVTAPPDVGEITGTVQSLGHCDLNPAALGGATISAQGQTGSYNATTDGAGEYRFYVNEADGPLSISVTAAGHEGASATGVPVVGATVTEQDFDLRALLGCSSADDTPLSATLASGGTLVETIQLDNAGLGAATFTTAELAPVTQFVLTMPNGDTRVATGALRSSAAGAAVAPTTVTSRDRGTAINLLLLSPDTLAPNNLGAALNAFPEINATVFPQASVAGLTLAQLLPYDVVLVTNNNQWQPVGNISPATVGNILADYVDAGGRVIAAHYVHDWDAWRMEGRFITQGYSPFTQSTLDRPNATYTLGTIVTPGHPILDGVSTISVTGGAAVQNVGIRPGATEIARWNNNDPLVAINAAGTVVGVNLLVGDITGGFIWTGNVVQLLRNAANELAVDPFDAEWLTVAPASGAIAAGGTAEVEVTFDAVPALDPGTYQARVRIEFDDGAGNTSQVDVPVSLTVTAGVAEADLSVAVDVSADPVISGDPVSFTVTASNAGPDAAASVAVTVGLPADGTLDATSGIGWSCAPAGSDLLCSIAGGLASGASSALTLDFTTGAPGTMTVNASIDSVDSDDPDTGNNQASASTTVVAIPTADLALAVSGAASAVAGTTFDYEVEVSCMSGDPATGVTVTVSLPADLSYVGATGTGWSCSAGAGSATCTLAGTLGIGAAPALAITVQAAASAVPGMVIAEFDVAADQLDDDMSNNHVEVETELTERAASIFSDGFED